jgi:hypothetical protein
MPQFLTSAQDEDSCPSHSIPRDSLQYAQYRKLKAGWALELVWMLWTREKSLTPAGNWILAIQPVAHHYTNWAILILRDKNWIFMLLRWISHFRITQLMSVMLLYFCCAYIVSSNRVALLVVVMPVRHLTSLLKNPTMSECSATSFRA